MTYDSIAYDRRAFLAAAGGTLASLSATWAFASPNEKRGGLVVSQSDAAKTGMDILASGGNAVDAAVAAALVGCVVNISKCGIGGYGGHMTIGQPGGKATSIDFNSTAPAAARADMFPLNKNGTVKGNINERGWLAAGVPGTLAGLQLALEKYGTMTWERILQPAIRSARDGFPLTMAFPIWRNPSQSDLSSDPASARLFSRHGTPLKKGETFRNLELANMLEQLAESGSAEEFYRGNIGERIAQAFQKNGGILTAGDMAAYKAREVKPLMLEWHGYTIATAPLTAGGLSVLQAIASVKALDLDEFPKESPERTQAWLEALRISWGDRLELLGDPSHGNVPVKRLLSEEYAQQSADKIKRAVAEKRPVPVATNGRSAGGTLHVSAADADGMMIAITLTHGNSFGAQVVVDGLGLILGHGMSRFDLVPGRPNSVAPGKRPLHNMCPMIVFRDGRPVLALGATGGRRIPNAIFQILMSIVGEGRSLVEASQVPRLHTEGGLEVYAERGASKEDLAHLKKIGYKIQPPMPSFVYAIQQPAAKKKDATATGTADYVMEEDQPPGIREPKPIITRGL